MLKSPLLRNIPLLFYRPHEFWTKGGLLLPGQRFNAMFVFSVLTLLSVTAGILGRFIFSISEPAAADYWPEAAAGVCVPFIILITSAASVYFLYGTQNRPYFKDIVTMAAVSMIPLLTVWMVILLIRYLFFFGLLGLFSLYVFRSGLTGALHVKPKKATRMTLIVFLVSLPLYVLSDLLCRYLFVTFVLYAR